jgi:hypothetical protein
MVGERTSVKKGKSSLSSVMGLVTALQVCTLYYNAVAMAYRSPAFNDPLAAALSRTWIVLLFLHLPPGHGVH